MESLTVFAQPRILGKQTKLRVFETSTIFGCICFGNSNLCLRENVVGGIKDSQTWVSLNLRDSMHLIPPPKRNTSKTPLLKFSPLSWRKRLKNMGFRLRLAIIYLPLLRRPPLPGHTHCQPYIPDNLPYVWMYENVILLKNENGKLSIFYLFLHL